MNFANGPGTNHSLLYYNMSCYVPSHTLLRDLRSLCQRWNTFYGNNCFVLRCI